GCGPSDFWGGWPGVVCVPKPPAGRGATWGHRHGLEVPPGTAWLWRTLPLDDLVVTVAFTPTARADLTAHADRAGPARRDPRTFPDAAVSDAG
ncbi:hypothetical protein V5O40_07620, partial [Micromonospora sp. S2-005]